MFGGERSFGVETVLFQKNDPCSGQDKVKTLFVTANTSHFL
jgi:hypothetical protein